MNARIGGLLLATLLSTIFVFTACDSENVAGTNNETHTKGTLYQANGKVAAGARVRIFAANQAVGDSLPVEQTKADANGKISLKLKRGYYSLLANDTAGRAVFIDSILSNGEKVEFDDDTLRPTGTLTGNLRVQPMHSPAIAWVHVLRTNLFANVDSSGAFRIEGVPEGRMEVVALSHLPEYTPTFRKAQAISDSTVDVGTLDLVYNGLPLVTGLAATYDSLTGVVTLTWKDTAFARMDGWVVYRSEGSSQTIDSIAFSSSNRYSDTVFAPFGGHGAHSNWDSIKTNFTYWVSPHSKDGGKGPRWNKATIQTKSPALAKRWTISWSAPTAGPTTSNSTLFQIDTLDAGLVVLERSSNSDTTSQYLLHLLDYNDKWSATRFPAFDGQMETPPVFWKGKIWLVHGYASNHSFPDTVAVYQDGESRYIPHPRAIFDSVRILSSADGIHWDSSEAAIPSDSVTAFRLKSTSTELHLIACHSRFVIPYSMDVSVSKMTLSSPDGKTWNTSQIHPVLVGHDGPVQPVSNFWNARIHSIDGKDWTSYYGNAPTGGWLIPGLSLDASQAIFSTSEFEMPLLTGANDLMIYGDLSRIGIARVNSPLLRQSIVSPISVFGITSWRGQLVVLGKTGLHFATITPNQ